MQLPCASRLLVFLTWLALASAAQALQARPHPDLPHHEILATLSAEDATLAVTSRVTLPADGPESWSFTLRGDSWPTLASPGTRLEQLSAGDDAVTRYRVTPAPGERSFTLSYRIQLDKQSAPIDSVFLSGADYWYPASPESLLTFDLSLLLPDGWSAMSQGTRPEPAGSERSSRRQHWHSATPQEQIYLVAGPFTEYSDTRDDLTAMALLRQPDQALASQYLAATHHYVALYEALLGDYPYSKFALVENVRETGYGMPSFTLLGSRVMRLPFILHSSYPHEILHNWWGNGVYTDYASGNWAEGLTSYLADHLLGEQQGRGVQYRRDTLQKYADYVSQQEDFPLTQFRGRHDATSQAVGYGKTLMVFHMLRRSLGDETFVRGLRRFYQDNRFRRAGFAALEDAFSAASSEDLQPMFRQWVERTGAPQLDLLKVSSDRDDRGFRLGFTVQQSQPGEPYSLRLPLAITLEGEDEAWQTSVPIEGTSQRFELALPARPLHLDVDPQFDLFRRLHPAETPPSISQALGAGQLQVVLPDAAPAAMKSAYRDLAESWRREQAGHVSIVTDAQISALPLDRSVWLLGWQNAFRVGFAERVENYAYSDEADGVNIAGRSLHSDANAVVVMARPAAAPQHALGWLAAQSPGAVSALARKLRHYGRYSYLAFEGEQANNLLRGQWPVLDSPLSQPVIQADGVRTQYQRVSVRQGAALVAAPVATR
jgi:hypothetical protein